MFGDVLKTMNTKLGRAHLRVIAPNKPPLKRKLPFRCYIFISMKIHNSEAALPTFYIF